MAKRHSTTLIPAAGYLRRSSQKQEKSLKEQRAEIQVYAKEHGYRIVRWYQDDGISGDRTEKRLGFLQMHRDACGGGGFDVILVWDSDRFGRFTSIEAGYWIHPLMQAGVRLETVTEGPINWDDFTGRVIYSLKQEGRHQFLHDLAKRATRGQRENAAVGGWNGGPIPYGFERGEFDADGRLVRRLQPGERKRAGCGHRVRLVPTRDQDKIRAVRYAFERFAHSDVSIRQLAAELAERGYPAPTSGGWQHSTVGKMLAKPIYCGTSRWGDRSGGKYSPIDETIVKEDVVEAIISPELFAKVQAKLGKISGKRYQRRQEYPLRGLIFCGHCGEPMQGALKRRSKRDGRGAYQYHQYLCAQYRRAPHQRRANCGHFAVDADRVVRWLVRALQEVFLGPGRDALVQEIERQLRGTAKPTDSNAGRLQKRLKDLDKQIDRLRRAIAQIDDTGLVEQLRQSKAERERIAAELAQAGQFSTPRDIHREAQRIADRTWELGERLGDADPATLRDLLQQTVSRITCRWDTTTTKGGRARFHLAEGRAELRDHPLLHCLSRGVAYAEAWERWIVAFRSAKRRLFAERTTTLIEVSALSVSPGPAPWRRSARGWCCRG